MSRSQYSRVSHFREGSMGELEGSTPRLTPRSSYSTGLEKAPSVNTPSLSTSALNTTSAKSPVYNYKPIVLRAPWLLSLLVLTLGLVGLLEVAIMRLPHGALNLKRRDETFRPPYFEVDTIARRSAAVNSSFSIPLPGATPPSAYVNPVSSSSVVDATSAESAYVDTKSTSTVSSVDVSDIEDLPAFYQTQSAYIHLSSSSTWTLMSTEESAYVQTTTTTQSTLPQNGLLPVMPTTSENAVGSAPPSAFIPLTSTNVVGPQETGAGDQLNPQPDQGSGTSDTTQGDRTSGDTSGDDQTFDDQSASVNDPDNGEVAGYKVTQTWSVEQLFTSTYLAVCVAVIYRLLWTVVYNAFNLIDPFRQLMDREGAPAERAFFAFYQNQSNLLGPIPALMKRRWALAFLGTAWTVVNLLPALASESIYVETNWDCPNPNLSNTNNPCNPRTFGNAAVLRVMQGLLVFVAIVLLFTTSLLVFQKTGLPTKPNSIITIASLMRHPRVVADFSEMPINASAGHMTRLLEGKRYRLGHYHCANGQSGYGIQPHNSYDSDGFVSPFGTFRHQYTPVDGSMFSEQQGNGLRRFQAKDFILAFFVLGAFGVVLAYYLVRGKSGFNDFFNSNTFGPRFILTLAGTVIASTWKSVEQDAITMAPYVRLFNRLSAARSTILLTPSSTPVSSTIRSLRHGYFFAAAITFLTLLAEALNIVISGVPYANGQLWKQYLASTYISLGILGLMIIMAILVIIRRFWEPKIPRKPVTLGAVMSYLCGSRILDDLEGMDKLDARSRDQRIKVLWKKYEFREIVRKDGKLGWTVDEAFDRHKF